MISVVVGGFGDVRVVVGNIGVVSVQLTACVSVGVGGICWWALRRRQWESRWRAGRRSRLLAWIVKSSQCHKS